jgi:outer membrane protein
MVKAFSARVWGAVLGVALTCAAVQAHADTLAEALALAYQTNPTLQAQRAQLRFQDEQYVQARAGYRPQASATGQFVYESSRINPCSFLNQCSDNTPETNAFTSNLTLSQPIYTFGRATAAVNQAEADILTQRENLRNVENQVMLDTITAYADVRRDQQALAIRIDALNVLKRQVEETKARFDVGEVTKTDVAQAEAELAQAQAAYSVAQAQLAVSRASYANTVGQSPGDLAPEPELKLLPATIEQAFATGEQNAPAIRSADYSTQSAGFQVAAAKAATKPTVSLQTTFNYNAQTIIPFDPSTFNRRLDVALVVSQPLYAGGSRESQIRQAVERENFFRIQGEGARRTTVQSISQSWNRLLAGRAAVAANMEQVRAARVAYEGAVEEQKVGLRTTFEVLQQEQILRDAELSLNTARHDTYVATASVLDAIGLLEARLLLPDVPVQPSSHDFHRLKNAPGYVPWEEVVKAVDSANTKGVVEAPPPLDAPKDAPISTAKPADVGGAH